MLKPKLVIFDVYGTLIRFGIKNHPYRKVMKWAQQQGRPPQPQDARTIMTQSCKLAEVFSTMGIEVPAHMLSRLQNEIEEEIRSLTLFDEVIPVLNKLSTIGVPVAICSNLAKPYGTAIDTLLPDFKFIRCLSYEVGSIKPEKAIYESIILHSKLTPQQCLFVGDTQLADYDGPKNFGFQARHLVRGCQSSNDRINDLTEILTLF